MGGNIWEVVGGSTTGGIVVRTGADVASPETAGRLACGALVEELEVVGDRIRYRRLTGAGPDTGWVSGKLKTGKELLVQLPEVWEVVGGTDKGGILVRTGAETTSPAAVPDRISCGALLRERELRAERLHFERLTGTGPASGWVSMKLQDGRPLVCRRRSNPSSSEPSAKSTADVLPGSMNKVPHDDGEWNPYVIMQIAPSSTDSMIKRAFRQQSLKTHPDQNPDKPEAAEQFRELMKAKEFLLNAVLRRAFNKKKGYLIDLGANPIYWSSWQVMFEELGDPEIEDIKAEGAAAEKTSSIDILILGCTALTGMLACEWMSKRPAGGPTWAIAARTKEKLDLVAAKFGRGPNFRGAFHTPEPSALEGILPKVNILVNYQGPPLVSRAPEVIALAVKHGCHYIDITGNVPLHRDMMRAHDEEAKRKGLVFLLHQGFTALPTDLLTLAAVKFLRERHKTECKRAVVYSWLAGGGMSGTTFAAGVEADKEDKAGGDDPFVLGGVRLAGVRPEDQDPKTAELDGLSAQWVGPDMLARGDTRIVRRSCELFEKESSTLSYGRNFNIRMYGLQADKMSANIAVFSASMPIKTRDKLADQKKVPPVGFGPPERLRKEALCVRICNAEGENGKEVHAVMRSGPGGFGDGYQSSGLFSVIIAVLLSTEWDTLPRQRRGFVTAAFLLEESSIWKVLEEMLMVFECHDGRAPQDLFRNVIGGLAAIGTDRGSLEQGEGQSAFKTEIRG